MPTRVLILGAGFGGLELSTLLSEQLGPGHVEVTLIDKSDAFVFGFSKLDDVDFLSGPKPTGSFQEPSTALVAEKQRFGATRRARWFGRERCPYRVIAYAGLMRDEYPPFRIYTGPREPASEAPTAGLA